MSCESLGAHEIREMREALGLGPESFPAHRRQCVAALFRIARAELTDEAGLLHPLDGAVDGSGAHPQARSGNVINGLHDGVAVQRAVGEGEKDVEDCWGQRLCVFVWARYICHGITVTVMAQKRGLVKQPTTFPRMKRNSPAVGYARLLGSDNLIEPLYNLSQFLGTRSGNSPADSFERQRPYLTDLYPRLLRETLGVTLQSEREMRALSYARQGDGNDGP